MNRFSKKIPCTFYFCCYCWITSSSCIKYIS